MSRRRTFLVLPFAAVLACLAFAASAAAVPEPPQGQIDLLAGTSPGFSGDGGPATAAQLSGGVFDTSVMPDGSVLIADAGNNRIRRVAPDGTITTVAGAAGICPDPTNPCGDGGPATSANLTDPEGVASTGDGGFLIADSGNARVRRVSPGGTILAAAGTGNICFGPGCGDGGGATSAFLSRPKDVAALPGGGYLIADTDNDVVRQVSAGGTITTVAGTYAPGFDGDGPAASRQLNDPFSVSPTPDGGFLVADEGNQRIRRVLGGAITTLVGDGTSCSLAPCGDGGLALSARLNNPQGVVSRPDGSFYISDSGNSRVRAVSAGPTTSATISNAAGDQNGAPGFSGDGGPANMAQLDQPADLSQCGNSVLVADFANNRVRWFGAPPIGGTAPCTPVPAPPTTTTTTTPTGGGSTPAPVSPTNAIIPLTVAPPVLGISVDATPIAGIVLVRLPGQSGFTPLSGAANLPIGTEFDTTKGTVSIDFVTGVDDPHSAEVSKGLFQTQQASATGSALQLNLTGKLSGCPRGGRATSRAAATPARAKKKSTRQVQTQAKGPVKTKGRYGAATVRGTAWTMKDTCSTSSSVRSGTLVAVTEGTVAVSDQVKHKTVLVKAGKRYFIAAKRRR